MSDTTYKIFSILDADEKTVRYVGITSLGDLSRHVSVITSLCQREGTPNYNTAFGEWVRNYLQSGNPILYKVEATVTGKFRDASNKKREIISKHKKTVANTTGRKVREVE